MDIRPLNDRMAVGPQIQPEDVTTLKEQGFTFLINNRPDGEEPGQPEEQAIEAAAKAAGLGYAHVPVTRGPSHADVEAMGEALEAAGDGKIFAFCRSGTRSCLTWAIARSEAGAEKSELEACASKAGYDLRPINHLL